MKVENLNNPAPCHVNDDLIQLVERGYQAHGTDLVKTSSCSQNDPRRCVVFFFLFRSSSMETAIVQLCLQWCFNNGSSPMSSVTVRSVSRAQSPDGSAVDVVDGAASRRSSIGNRSVCAFYNARKQRSASETAAWSSCRAVILGIVEMQRRWSAHTSASGWPFSRWAVVEDGRSVLIRLEIGVRIWRRPGVGVALLSCFAQPAFLTATLLGLCRASPWRQISRSTLLSDLELFRSSALIDEKLAANFYYTDCVSISLGDSIWQRLRLGYTRHPCSSHLSWHIEMKLSLMSVKNYPRQCRCRVDEQMVKLQSGLRSPFVALASRTLRSSGRFNSRKPEPSAVYKSTSVAKVDEAKVIMASR
ncbi:hypothetical protein T10_605 [Trichinella papuae]|uniref:Uncharacterized protein n=1 Tax=Trichinella papuae TaxID=268474 RepID=A0A0V1MHK4_9BILA|nr:hypothetical protein T10_605 [Trichinella papuae]